MDLGFTALGTRVRVVVEDCGVSRRVERLLEAFPPAGAGPTDVVFALRRGDPRHRTHDLHGPDGQLLSTGHLHTVLLHLVSALTEAAVSRFDGLAVHSGAVAIDGRAVAMVGASGVGKTTLTACCLQAGFDYVSDEALCLSSGSGRVVPFPKPLAVSGDSATLLGLPWRRWAAKDLVTPAALEARATVDALPLAHVVLLARTGLGSGVPIEQPTSTMVATLLSMAFNAYRDPAGSVALASAVARSARCWTLDIGDPHQGAAELRALLGADDRTARSPAGDPVTTSRK